MLPFLLKKKQETGVVMKTRSPDEKPEENQEDDSGMEACAKELMSAVKADDHKAVARIIKDMFQIADSEPHEEGPHVEPHSYQAQNIKAGENR